jgi:hypothetical protein
MPRSATTPSPPYVVVPAPDRPRHVRAMDKLKIWGGWFTDKYYTFKYRNYGR